MATSSFNLNDELGELRVNFQPYADVDVVMPEPTYDQIEAFRASYLASLDDLGVDDEDLDTEDGVAVTKAISDAVSKRAATEAAQREFMDRIYSALVEFCGNVFTLDQFNKLPYRGQRIFLGWVMGQFFRGEAQRPAITS